MTTKNELRFMLDEMVRIACVAIDMLECPHDPHWDTEKVEALSDRYEEALIELDEKVFDGGYQNCFGKAGKPVKGYTASRNM